MASLKQLEVPAPPVVPWAQWYARQPWEKLQGQHVLFVGPTQSGKSVLCRLEARVRRFVVVFGTKPVDPSLDAYVEEDGYVRIDHWPPTPADYRKGREQWPDGYVRFILWPDIKKRADLRSFRDVYAKCLDEVFIDGRWCVVVDEGLWLSSKTGLNLPLPLGDMAYGGASNLVSLYILVQRPANVPPVVWTSCSWAEIFHLGRTDDVRELASLGVYPPRQTMAIVHGLKGHAFLDLPCRAGSEWSITEVDRAWL